MIAYDDEVLSVTSVVDWVLDSAKVAPDGQTPAQRVVITNGPTADTSVIYRFNSSPVPASNQGHILAVGGSVTIDGYDNIVNLKMRLKGGTTATVFVTYYR